MEALLELPIWQGLIVIILSIALPSLVVIFIARRLLIGQLTKQHERIGRLLFRVTASLIALLISLSYANEKIAYNKVVNSLEEEASLISTVFLKLRMHQSNTAEEIRHGLSEYVEYTIDDQWKDVIDNPYFSKMMGTIVRINILVRSLPDSTRWQAQLKSEITNDIDMITKTMQVRFYSARFTLPILTYILGVSLVIVWCFYAVYKVDSISVSFISLYNMFIAVVLYFVIMLGNPLAGALKIQAKPFNILIEKGLDNLPY